MTYVALTFDDGYIEHYEIAKMLYRKGLAATFFIIAGLKEYRGRKLLMAKPDLVKRIRDMGHEIASHTYHHKDLTKLTPQAIHRECTLSKKILEKVIEDEVKGIAYPYGSYNEAVIDIVRKYYKYGRGMGSKNKWNEELDPYKISGIGIRHLWKVPLKILLKKTKLIVIIFHTEKPTIIKLVIESLQTFNIKINTLSETLSVLGLI